MESIPVLGTAIVNTPHWVWRLFYSIDYPVDNFVVFNNNGRGQIDYELDLLRAAPHRYIKNVHVCHLPANLGCSGAWNLIIKSFMKAPYWVISNHDVMYEPGFLREMAEEAAKPEIGVVHGKNGGWDIFALKDWMVQRYGLFDENLYPGYCEDMDYGMRFIHDDVPRTLSLEAGYYHGNKKDDYSDGSQTWRSEPAIARGVHVAHEMNKAYVTMKWNEAWQGHVDGETHKTPFNLEQMPVSFTTYDLDFVRRKHLGF